MRFSPTAGFLPAVLLVIGTAVSANEPSSLPRYQLTVGQTFEYETVGSFKYTNGTLDESKQATFWVIAKNADESWRILCSERDSDQSQVMLVTFDLHPDGTIIGNDSWRMRFTPYIYFPKLPDSLDEMRNGWTGNESRSETVHHYSLIRADDKDSTTLKIRDAIDTDLNTIYDSTQSITFAFDTKAGIVQSSTNKSTQNYGFQGSGTGNTTLKSATMVDREMIETLAREADQYIAATKKYYEFFENASKDATKVQQLLKDAKELLENARKSATHPVIVQFFEHLITQHDKYETYYTDIATRYGEVVGKPAAPFETTDFWGTSHSLDQYRGKVVVLDFWYRGCGWCIRAMPQIKQLAERFKDQDVAVLGMNTDSNEEDALFVIKTMKLNYANLKAEGLPEQFHVRSFPTLILIDPAGNVHDLHVGYSPDLAEKVGKQIQALLDARKAATAN